MRRHFIVSGIQKCGSLSIFASLPAISAENSFNKPKSIGVDKENEPSDGPTLETTPKDDKSSLAVS